MSKTHIRNSPQQFKGYRITHVAIIDLKKVINQVLSDKAPLNVLNYYFKLNQRMYS